MRGQLVARRAHRFLHLAQDVHAALARLRQRHLHDFLGDALDLDVHLQRGHAGFGARHLEVHIAEVILVTEDVGQHRELAAVLDQAHRHAGHVRLDRHARIHQRQAAAADRGHRRGAIGLGDLGDHAQRVAELLLGRQHRDQRALGQTAVADLAPLGRADAARFAGGERRHVVVEHEAVAELAHQRVDDLLVLLGAEGGGDQRLGLAAREQRRAVGARQHALADRNRPHGTGVAAVDARLAVEDLAAHDLRLQVEQDAVDHVVVGLGPAGGHVLGDLRPHLGVDRVDLLGARLLAADLVGGLHAGLGPAEDLADQRLVLRRRLPVPRRLAGLAHQVMDGVDRGLHLLVAVDHRAQHHVLGKLLRLGLHHQHGALGARNHQVELRLLDLRCGRVQHVLAIDIADARRTDRALERNAGDRQRRRRADHRRDIRVDFRIDRHHVHNDLHFIEEGVGKQRTDRTVDQAAGQCLLLARTALALEEAPRDLAGCVGLLDVIDGQREEVLAGLGLLAGHDGGQHDRVVHRAQHGTGGLASNFAGFEGDGMGAVLEGLGDFVKHLAFLSISISRCRSRSPDQRARRVIDDLNRNTCRFVRPWRGAPGYRQQTRREHSREKR